VSRPARAFRVRRPGLVEPWGEPAEALCVLGRPIRERQDLALAAVGLRVEADVDEPGRDNDALYLDADIDVAPGAIAAWLKVAATGAQLATVERPARVGEIEVEEQVFFRDGEGVAAGTPGAQPARLVGLRWGEATRPVMVPPLGLTGRGPLPGPFGQGQVVDWAIDLRTAVTVRHWVHLLRAHLAALGVEIWTGLTLRPHALLWTWLRYPLRRHLSVVGRGCKIHPSASLEGCIVEDGASIGAFSHLQACHVGKGAIVEDHVTARLSSVGAGAHLSNYSMFNMSVLGERSSCGHIGAQASVIGRDTFVSTFATLQDLNLRGNVKVWMDGGLRDVGIPFLGCAVGHGVKIGAGVSLAPGRAVPSGVSLVAEGAVSRLPRDLAPGSYRVVNGQILPG